MLPAALIFGHGFTQASEHKELLDSIWSHAVLYKDNENPILQEFKLRGRYHGQYHSTDSDRGDHDAWIDRRSRIGFDAKLFDKKLEIRADFQSNDGFRDAYDGLVDAYLRWKVSENLSITAGKTKPLIGHYDWLESTNSQPTFERSQIFNQLNINRATALTIEGKKDSFSWRAGIYSNDTPSTTRGSGAWGDGEFGDLDGGYAISAGFGYDFSGQLQIEKADFRFDWLHSERKTGDLVLGRYDEIISATFIARDDRKEIVTEAYYASGGDGNNPDVFGFFIQPAYDIVPGKLQIVGRYSYAVSEDDEGVSFRDPGNSFRGDSYHGFYLGAQYFIHGDKLKILSGIEYSILDHENSSDSYEGYTFLTGLRLSF